MNENLFTWILPQQHKEVREYFIFWNEHSQGSAMYGSLWITPASATRERPGSSIMIGCVEPKASFIAWRISCANVATEGTSCSHGTGNPPVYAETSATRRPRGEIDSRLPRKTKNDRSYCSHTSGPCAMADSLLVHKSTRITVHAESVSRDTIHTPRPP